MSADNTEEMEDEFSPENLFENLARHPIQRCRNKSPDSDNKTTSKSRGSSAPSKSNQSSARRSTKISFGKDSSFTIETTDLYPKIEKSDEQESSTSSLEQKPKKHSEVTPPKKSKGGKVDGETSRNPGWGFNLTQVLGIFFCVVLGFLLGNFIPSWSTNTPLEYPVEPLFNVDAVVSTLKEAFSALDEKNFRILRASLSSISKDREPKAPAVLLLASLEGNEQASTEFSTQLVKTLSGNYTLLSGEELRGIDNPKKHIDHTINEDMKMKKTNVFLVSQLELINFETMLIFHSFCDDQNAPYKQAVFVLTVSCVEVDPSWKWDQVGEECLKQHWENGDEDMIGPLITRLTPSVLILRNS